MSEWPFEEFAGRLMADLFDSAWERRHGAALGLRHLLKLHGRSAGKSTGTPAEQVHDWLSTLRELGVVFDLVI